MITTTMSSNTKKQDLPVSPVPTVIVPSTKVISDSIQINKKSAAHFCVEVMLKLSIATTDFAKAMMAVLQDNTDLQQLKTKELLNHPLLKVPDLEKKSGSTKEYKNQTLVQSYQDSNQQIDAHRSMIQQELSSAQQRAQSNQQTVNSTFSLSMQVLQAACSLLEMIEILTTNANLTRPAQ